jgi:hypothetical protein
MEARKIKRLVEISRSESGSDDSNDGLFGRNNDTNCFEGNDWFIENSYLLATKRSFVFI